MERGRESESVRESLVKCTHMGENGEITITETETCFNFIKITNMILLKLIFHNFMKKSAYLRN